MRRQSSQLDTRQLNLEREWIGAQGGLDSRFSVALSGGGVRAASVSRGVLDYLIQRKLIDQVDYISSVSGGSYAACELMQTLTSSRESLPARPDYSRFREFITALFEASMRLMSAVFPVSLLLLVTFKSISDNILGFLVFMLAIATVLLHRKPGNFAPLIARIGLSTQIIIATFGLTKEQGLPVAALAITLVLLYVHFYVAAMPHRAAELKSMQHWPKAMVLSLSVATFFVAWNTVGRPQISPLASWSLPHLAVLTWALLALMYQVRVFFDVNGAQPLYSYYRNKLAKSYLPMPAMRLKEVVPRAPYPLINVTANDGQQEYQMELAPLYIGPLNGRYFQTDDLAPDISLADAMASSGSALDFTRHNWNFNAALSFFLGGTGYWLRTMKGRSLGAIGRATYNLPGPTIIRLSDGGFTDNLGLLALLRRHVSYIVCLDAAYDPGFHFDDLRRVCNAAVLDGLADIDITDLSDFSQQLRFAQPVKRFILLKVSYSNGTFGEICLIKLADRQSQQRINFLDYPHFTTNDQFLEDNLLKDLRQLGKTLAQELFTDSRVNIQSSTSPIGVI